MRSVIRFALLILLFMGLFIVGDFVLGSYHNWEKEQTKQELQQLKSYNKEHNKKYKNIEEIVETKTYREDFEIYKEKLPQDVFDKILGIQNYDIKVNFKTEKGGEKTIDYRGNLSEGVYKDGEIIIKHNPIKETTEYEFKE